MTAMRRRVMIAGAVLIAIQGGAVALYLTVERARQRSADPPTFRVERLSGRDRAPALALERSDGTATSIESFRGRPVLVHFWATWCPPCVEELPGLLAAARERHDLALVAISVDDDWQAVSRFFDGKVPSEIVRATEPEAHRRYDVVTLPDTYLISGDGRLVLRYGGARDWRSAAAAAHLADAARRH